MEMIVLIARVLALACRGHQELVLENLALRQLHALKRTRARPRLRWRDRLFWIVLARTWRRWHTALVMVKPDTVVRWHREWFRRRWRRRSAQIGRRSRGRMPRFARSWGRWRPPIPFGGAPRIDGELRKVGIEVSKRTVSPVLRRPGRPPSQTWRTFLTNNVAALGSIDFFAVPMITGRILFVFLVLWHHRRRIVHVNVTGHPTAPGQHSR
jgi:putative transposase